VNPSEDLTADVPPAIAAELHARGAVTVIDVREDDEWTTGHISGAIHIPLAMLDPASIDASKPIITVCRSGNRSGKAADKLRAVGLMVRNMTGGMQDWVRTGLPVDAADGTAGSAR
jgi:rhodanese-related sulfurtransferase